MTPRTRITALASVVLVVSLALSVVTLRKIDHIRAGATLQEVLYIPSATTIKRLSLGYTGLMADVYWTRVVQYFGGKHYEHSKQYELLKPLLEITTTLDPHLIVAYEFGSVFLAQRPPEGAGDPRAAADLVRRGIQQNPDAWRLWYHLGFIEWQELHDPSAAAEAFLEGSKVPGAQPWMKVMAAQLAQHAGDAETARYLWTNIYESTRDPMIRKNAQNRLTALKIDQDVIFLQNYLTRYWDQYGHAPTSFHEMVANGWLRRVPLDPHGNPYQIRDGRVVVSDPEDFPFITQGLPSGEEASAAPKKPSN